MVKNLPLSARGARDVGLISGLGGSPGGGNGNLLQYSCLRNPIDRGAVWVTVHGLQRVRHDGTATEKYSTYTCITTSLSIHLLVDI